MSADTTKEDRDRLAQELWSELMAEAKDCRRTWGMGFPVISTFLLRKYWAKITGWLPPEN